MIYLVIFAVLFALELFYLRIADHFDIVDKPNERSSHTIITRRGGGVIFYLAVLIYFLTSDFAYSWFFLGLTMTAIVSFIDDICTLSNRIRLLIQFGAVLLMAYELNVLVMEWYFLLIAFVVIVGVINAYNFMDGINGITASYSLALGGTLMIINNRVGFLDQDLLAYVMLGVLVFAFFNFRYKAKCFAGDVGSVTIAYVLLFALGTLIIKTGNLIYFLLLAVYGIDTVWTILRRLYLKENIFEAHRSHLYQILVNEVGANSLIVSFLYGGIQFVIGLGVIYFADKEIGVRWLFTFVLLGGLSIIYLLLKSWSIKTHLTMNLDEE